MQGSWRIKDLLQWTTRYFSEKAIIEPRLEAEVLLAHVLGKCRVYLYANYQAPVNQNERKKFREYIKRRINGEPAAYITGDKEFMSLEFKVSPAVLIPRPETELLVEKALDLAGQKNTKRICDVGTGSGAIAISLAVYLPEAEIYAVDLSTAALAVARENAQRHGINVEFFEGDLMLPLMDQKPFDIIVANLPYIPEDEYRQLDPGIRDYEPKLALAVKGDGLDKYRTLIPQSYRMLKPGGYLLLEIACNQGERALELVKSFTECEVLKDNTGQDRLLKARKEK